MANDALNLQDIHLPTPISWWPPAWGWWILAIATCALLTVIMLKGWQFWQRKRRHRLAIQEVIRLQKIHEQDEKALLQALSQFLRRLAIHYYGRERVAPLFGKNWLQFLDETGQSKEFSQGIGRIFAEGPYNTQKVPNSLAVIALTRLWIKKQA